MYRFLAKFYPKKLREAYTHLLLYSGIRINPGRFIGFIALFGFLLALLTALYIKIFFKLPFLILFAALLFLFQILSYFLLLLRADAKAKFVEEILPDALQLMASNLRAGLTTDKALLLSARPEFGPFQDEINQVGKEITTGKEIEQALLDMTKRIKSEKLDKTMALITSGLRSGGKLSSLLEQTARNLRQEKILDDKIRANVMMYVIFVLIAVCFGAPFLFGLSSFLIEVFTKILGEIQMPKTMPASTLPMVLSKISIEPSFVITFYIVFLITISILGSLILGLISKGKEREGIKFMPILILLSLGVFFLSRFLIKKIMGSFFGL